MGRSVQQYFKNEKYEDAAYEGGTPPAKSKKRVHRWNEADTRVLPHAIQKALNNLGIPLPWDEVAIQMNNGQTGGAIAQHMSKDLSALKGDGVKLPSPLKRGGKRSSRNESISIPPTPASTKVSKTGVNNLSHSQGENGRRGRKSSKKSSPKVLQRDTPHPYPRQNGQYTLMCAPTPGMPAFAQRELRPHPPPFFGPSSPAVNHPARPPPTDRDGSPPSPAQGANTSSGSQPVQHAVDHSVNEPEQEVVDLSESESEQESDSEQESQSEQEPEPEQETTSTSVHEPVQEDVDLPVSEPEHEPSTALPETEEQFYIPDFDFDCESSMNDYLPAVTSWSQTPWSPSSPAVNVSEAMIATRRDPWGYDSATINPAVFLEAQPCAAYYEYALSQL